MSNNIIPFPTNAEVYRASTDAAALCKDIVLATAVEIQKRKYVKVEGWQAIAVAHGCVGSACDVEVTAGGIKARGQVKRMSDGMVIAEGEGFVGEDEPTWYGGIMRRWKWGERRGEKVWYDEEMPKRLDYAIRAMAQTRAISRACRSAFAHVVVLIDANLSTTPAEEVPMGGWDDEPLDVTPRREAPAPERAPEPRQEAAQAPAANGRYTGAQARRPAPVASQRAYAPAPNRNVNRVGARVPAPVGELPQDWQRWFRAVSRRVEAAEGPDEVIQIGKVHAADVERGDKVVEGAAASLRELMEARLQELRGKAA